MQQDTLVPLCRLYENTSKTTGRKYFVGNLSFTAKLLLLENKDAREGEPGWTLFVVEREPRPQEAGEPARGRSWPSGREQHGKPPHLSLVPEAINRQAAPCGNMLPALPQDAEPCPREGPKCDTPKCDRAIGTGSGSRDGARPLAGRVAGHAADHCLPVWTAAHAGWPLSPLRVPCR